MEEAGAFACVLECVPAALAAKITKELHTMATIGIGAGNECDGQVLVCNDLLGVSTGFTPKFVKNMLISMMKPLMPLKLILLMLKQDVSLLKNILLKSTIVF